MIIDKGIIDHNKNPFTRESWIQQGFGFTPKRQEQAEKIFGSSAKKILITKAENYNRYVAFVSIRWGFAKIVADRLTPTDKWQNRFLYDGHGQLLKKY